MPTISIHKLGQKFGRFFEGGRLCICICKVKSILNLFRAIKAHRIYTSLNLGVSGVITDDVSMHFIQDKFEFGSILNLEVVSSPAKTDSNHSNLIHLKVPDYYLRMTDAEVESHCQESNKESDNSFTSSETPTFDPLSGFNKGVETRKRFKSSADKFQAKKHKPSYHSKRKNSFKPTNIWKKEKV